MRWVLVLVVFTATYRFSTSSIDFAVVRFLSSQERMPCFITKEVSYMKLNTFIQSFLFLFIAINTSVEASTTGIPVTDTKSTDIEVVDIFDREVMLNQSVVTADGLLITSEKDLGIVANISVKRGNIVNGFIVDEVLKKDVVYDGSESLPIVMRDSPIVGCKNECFLRASVNWLVNLIPSSSESKVKGQLRVFARLNNIPLADRNVPLPRDAAEEFLKHLGFQPFSFADFMSNYTEGLGVEYEDGKWKYWAFTKNTNVTKR